MKKHKVKYKKLGRQKADGQTFLNGTIEIDERLKGKRWVSAILHECLHEALPTAHEDEILRIEGEISPTLWNELKKNPDKFK